MKHLILLLATLMLVLGIEGCTKYVVRDTAVYQTELNQYDSWATKQAGLLKQGMTRTEFCTCTEGKFTDKWCSDSADFILTIESRAAWHKAMSLYLAGVTEERPPEAPPAIPPSSSLCPAAPKGGK